MKGSAALTALVRSTSVVALTTCLALPYAAAAQTAPASEGSSVQPTGQDPQAEDEGTDIVVTGIRASLDRAIEIKRNSAGVVDAISAEDIGKFPDTNLAESLQRITGVSINRVNGEGSQVSVRGFSGGFNLVTLNGRQLPASNVDTSGAGDFARGTSRSFDFQNLASEGVSALEVYKTGRAAIPSGGIGASINIVTRRPLDARESGLSGSIGAKALYDTSVEQAESQGKNRILPELSGLVSWSDPAQQFGISVFGSYQRRDSTSAQSAPNYFNVVRTSDFLNPGDYISATTQITNAPTSEYVLIPNDSRYQFSDNRRERINAQAVAQWRPVDTLTFTADALFAQNNLREIRSEQTNWFNRPFNEVRFGGNSAIPTAVFLRRDDDGTKDYGYEQQLRATQTQLQSYGLNGKWEITDAVTLNLDGYHAVSNSTPDNPNGTSATLVSLGAPVGQSQSVDFSSGFPVQTQIINDAVRGNGNGVLDLGDLGSQVARTVTSSQRQRINGGRADLGWDLGGGSRFDFGGSYTDTVMTSARTQTQQQLGDWGIGDPGIIQRLAPELVDTFCLTCKFDRFNPRAQGPAQVAFRGNAISLLDVLSSNYANNPVNTNAIDFDQVGEKVWSVYGQITWKGEIAGRPANLVFGTRYEETRTRSLARQVAPSGIIWQSDNDFSVVLPNAATATPVTVTQTGRYSNLLPAIDFNIEVARDLIVRASASRTLARPDYGNLFASTTVGGPSRPTALDGVGTGSSGNANLRPLVSDNFDVSVEWYYKPSSFVSVGFFEKRVRNFLGSGVFNRDAFGLRDPSSGAAGSRSGTARDRLTALGATINDLNLFSYTALLQQNGGDVAAADAEYRANSSNGEFNAVYANALLGAVDVVANSADPLFNFAISQPINNQDGRIYGFEIAGQHFFGDTGFGVAASYTKVNGDVNVDVTASPDVNVFALTGLGDSANASLIYDKNGLSARVSYNWRDKFLSATNQGDDRNPIFTDAFGTLDFNISYELNERIALSFEGVNLTSEPVVQYGRDRTALVFAQELKPRLLLGARYRF
ncbi:TonB-dependent receptor [Sphingomonas spermidinifaciens]|uniref:TonB-dependent receptor n=1 Tax=Sphingomonas spermidinifaciens TaxID=1141889 RepID=A0A2A4B9M9_9SPHN|nr:TonB-dependent receptor [Sphingomonas spermidinifaciens]PCD04777.1 TonB-dependent receptor [Sphingomonas spermidinifaciens]